MRHRVAAYLAAVLINLSIVTGTLAAPAAPRNPVVRIRQRLAPGTRFAPGEVLDSGGVLARPLIASASAFHTN